MFAHPSDYKGEFQDDSQIGKMEVIHPMGNQDSLVMVNFHGSLVHLNVFVAGQMILFDEQFVEECLQLTPWKFNSSPLKIDLPKRKPACLPTIMAFSGELLNFAGVTGWFFDPASLCFGNVYKTLSSKMMENCRSTLCKIKI